MHDIVYILKKDVEAEELRYSLRSLKNFPHGKVWFYGGKPDGITPDRWVRVFQKGVSNWGKVIYTIEQACRNDEITEDFWLFNDDFFVMKPVKSMKPIYDKTLQRRIEGSEKRTHGKNLYSRELAKLNEFLIDEGFHTFNYAVHMPMLINRKKALEVMRKYPVSPMFRSLYGNVLGIGGVNRNDCKVIDHDKVPKMTTFLSTTDTSFRDGKVGVLIREAFPDKCEYEV